MVNDQTYIDAGLPVRLLGRGWQLWRGEEICSILRHYDKHIRSRVSKFELLELLNEVCQERGFNRTDFKYFRRAQKFGYELSAPRPAITRSVISMTRTRLPSSMFDEQQAGVVDTTATITEEHESDAQDEPELGQSSFSPLSAMNPIGQVRPPFTVDSKSPNVECNICMEDLAPECFPKRRITANCNHAPNACLECLRQSIATQFSSNIWDQIDCPTCKERLGYMDMKVYADPEVFKRCGGRTCINCDTVWHPDTTCEEMAKRREEEARTARAAEEEAATQYLGQNSKLCPRCRVRGEKIDGCDYMTCPRCHYEYCWICLADFRAIRDSGNDQHAADFRYHSNNIAD